MCLHLPLFEVLSLQMIMKFLLGLIDINGRHSNLSFAQHFVDYCLLHNDAKKNQRQGSYKREAMHDKFVTVELGRQKSQ